MMMRERDIGTYTPVQERVPELPYRYMYLNYGTDSGTRYAQAPELWDRFRYEVRTGT